MYVGRGLWNT